MSDTILPPDWDEESENGILFQSEATSFKLDNPTLLTQWIEAVIAQEEKVLQSLSFIFCNDTYLHKINVEYLQHDTYTDIITFPYGRSPKIEGDIFISIDRVRENAQTFQTSFEEELHRVIIHGVLHLCGYGDKSTEEKAKMRTKEDEALHLLHNLE